jgi:hypothetical protein
MWRPIGCHATTTEIENLVDDMVFAPLERLRAELRAEHPEIAGPVLDALIARDLIPHARARTRATIMSGMLSLADETKAH